MRNSTQPPPANAGAGTYPHYLGSERPGERRSKRAGCCQNVLVTSGTGSGRPFSRGTDFGVGYGISRLRGQEVSLIDSELQSASEEICQPSTGGQTAGLAEHLSVMSEVSHSEFTNARVTVVPNEPHSQLS